MNKDNVTFTGKEYIQYLKYRDACRVKSHKEISKHLTRNRNKVFAGLLITVIIAACISIVDSLTYEPIVHTQAQLLNMAIGFLVVCVGISWVIHGVGFYLVRR